MNYDIKFRRNAVVWLFLLTFIRDTVREILRKSGRRHDVRSLIRKTCKLNDAANPSLKILTRENVWRMSGGYKSSAHVIKVV